MIKTLIEVLKNSKDDNCNVYQGVIVVVKMRDWESNVWENREKIMSHLISNWKTFSI